MGKKTKIGLGVAGGVVVLAGVLYLLTPTIYLAWVASRDLDDRDPVPQGMVDDAARLYPVPVGKVWDAPKETAEAEKQLGQLLKEARAKTQPVSIAGARRSMGGHTNFPRGIQLNMLPLDAMELDEEKNILRVQAGARWSQVVPYLDARGRSVAVMQPYNDFSVGGSVSVNCNGWQHNSPPIASTVESLRLMKSDGTVVRCSRTENAELFSLVLGGYGLFGVILDLELRVVPNARYRLESVVVPIKDFRKVFHEKVDGKNGVGMVYGRISVAPDVFLGEGILNVYHEDPAGAALPKLSEIPPARALKRTAVRGAAMSGYGKGLRWDLEKKLQRKLNGGSSTRNELLNSSYAAYENRGDKTTEIVQEYFVPDVKFNPFVDQLRELVTGYRVNLVDVTVHGVREDTDTLLRYADGDMFVFVLRFNCTRNKAGDVEVEVMAEDLVKAALDVSGRYSLAYRPYASVEQFVEGYPKAMEFFELKQTHDPLGLFQNQFLVKYGYPFLRFYIQ